MTTIATCARVAICLLWTISLSAQVHLEQLTVDATMDIYRAAGNVDGSDGIAPAVYTFPAGPGQAVSFLSVTGTWTCSVDVVSFGPDGTTSGLCYGLSIINPEGALSGINFTDFAGAMVGVFLEDSLPVVARQPLRFYLSNPSAGGNQTNFRLLGPEIGEVFFIGDGLTGTGTGRPQTFVIPPTATHLYLGFVDTCAPVEYTSPGCYSDNAGALTARFALHRTR